ncbi:MAG TPA: hypothetical protein VMZ33_04060 [Candidatus Limnocylindrales bacterium]|nr:hypothetical protein [Candidatus Limnocylindrales bacterium]
MDRLKSENPEADPTPIDESLPLHHAGEGEVLEDPVEDASADSFPASDPPSWTGSSAASDPSADVTPVDDQTGDKP